MTTGWDMLPETAKALSAPITKLIEVVSAGCGNLYKPSSIKRTAKAEAEALIITEEAKAQISEIQARTQQRLSHIEERRQLNIEAICNNAAILLPNEVSENPVDPDWISRFFNECQDISNEQMRTAWARILAGEVSKPGSFSQRTLSLLRNISTEEANLFNLFCKVSFKNPHDDSLIPMIRNMADWKYLESIGLSFMSIRRLIDAGLLSENSNTIGIANTNTILLKGSKLSILCESETESTFSVGKIVATFSGNELANICEHDIPEDRFNSILNSIPSPFKAKAVNAIIKEVGINPDTTEFFFKS